MGSREEDQRQEYIEKRKAEALRNNDGYQKRLGMTPDEKREIAVDKFTRNIKEFAEKNGKEITGEAARRMAQKLGEDATRKKK